MVIEEIIIGILLFIYIFFWGKIYLDYEKSLNVIQKDILKLEMNILKRKLQDKVYSSKWNFKIKHTDEPQKENN